jgi:hypothetical protein
MNESAFRGNFPTPIEVPALLLKLRAYQERKAGEWYSGYFSLIDHGMRTAEASFDGDQTAAKEFVLFGTDPDGSSYGFWIYEGRTLDTAPVVYLGSEGEGWTVLANTVEEFLALLALGKEDLGFLADRLYFPEPEEVTPGLKLFRRWLKKECGIVTAADPAAIVSRARQNHPDLQNWLRKWQEVRYGPS